jgi:hypothetical protein
LFDKDQHGTNVGELEREKYSLALSSNSAPSSLSQAFAPISQRTKRLIMLAQVSSQVGGQ